mmetsp:Transcript_13508/g.40244  ORF Transcript_13508/g.40244 Transcript_13508/m.40244 type:complete len:233 (+) Transcript_13508:395-1093(+)
MLFPMFEIPMLCYLVMFHFHVYNNYLKGKVGKAFYTVCRFTLPVEIILMAWFRMIFVIGAFDDVNGHTSFFQLFQVLLAIVCAKNMHYYNKALNAVDKDGQRSMGPLDQVSRHFTGRQLKDSIQEPLQWIYLLTVVATTAFKIAIVRFQFAGKPFLITQGPNKSERDMAIAGACDRTWMVLNAIMPMVFAYVQSQYVDTLEFTLDSAKQVKGGAAPSPEDADGLQSPEELEV